MDYILNVVDQVEKSAYNNQDTGLRWVVDVVDVVDVDVVEVDVVDVVVVDVDVDVVDVEVNEEGC